MSWNQQSGKLSSSDMSEEEYQTHCETMGRIVAAAFNEHGQFRRSEAKEAVNYYMKHVGLTN